MARMVTLYRNWSQLRHIRAQLTAMSDYQLEDLGLCRADIPR